MGGVQHRLDQPFIAPEPELVDDQRQDNGNRESPQQAVEAEQNRVLDHPNTVR